MSTSLIDNDQGYITTSGMAPEVGPHCVDLFLSGGRMFLKVTMDGANPGGGLREVDLYLSRQQADELAQGLAKGLRSL